MRGDMAPIVRNIVDTAVTCSNATKTEPAKMAARSSGRDRNVKFTRARRVNLVQSVIGIVTVPDTVTTSLVTAMRSVRDTGLAVTAKHSSVPTRTSLGKTVTKHAPIVNQDATR